MRETTPHENKPNLEPPFDIIRTILDEQALDETCDEMEQWSRALSNLDILNKRLANENIRVTLESNKYGIYYDGYEELIMAVVKEGIGSITGYVGGVNYGKLMGTPGYMIHLITPEETGIHPFFPYNPPAQIQYIVAATNIIDYHYLPTETPDQQLE